MRLQIYKLLQFLFFYLIPVTLIIIRNAPGTGQERFRFLGLVVAMIFTFIYLRKKTKIMRIKETKEIEDNDRRGSTIWFFYIRFATLYVFLMLSIRYIYVNFETLYQTLIMVAVSLIVGAFIRLDMANRYGI